MAEPDATRDGREVAAEGFGGEAVVHVPASIGDALLEKLWVRSVFEHRAVEVGLDDEVACPLHEGNHLVGEASGIGDEAEGGTWVGRCGREDVAALLGMDELDEVAVVVARIVWHSEGGDAEVAHLKGDAHFGGALLFEGYFFGHEAVAHHPLVHQRSGIDGEAELEGEGTDRLDVVGVIVGDEDGSDAWDGESIVAQVLAEGTHADAQVDEDGRAAGFEIVAVAGASAAETDEIHGKGVVG